MKTVNIVVNKIDDRYKDIPLPQYSTEGSSGMDIRAAVEEPILMKKGDIKLIPTNIRVELPLGYEIQVRPRSGLAIKHGIGVLNSPGTIDSDYRGEIKIILFNFGEEEFKINRGDRIAQLVIAEVFKAEINVSDQLNSSLRGDGGFGHTGTK